MSTPSSGAGACAPRAPVVFLTFDVEKDGVSEVLSVLRANGVLGTMFLLGKWARRHAGLVRQMVADCHALGNHSYSHPDMTRLSPDAARDQIVRAEDAILRASGGVSPRPRFRFPYALGEDVPELLGIVAGQGYTACGWTIDSQDYRGLSSAAIAQRILALSQHGSIVVMHPHAPGTPGAQQAIIDGLRTRGFRFGTL